MFATGYHTGDSCRCFPTLKVMISIVELILCYLDYDIVFNVFMTFMEFNTCWKD